MQCLPGRPARREGAVARCVSLRGVRTHAERIAGLLRVAQSIITACEIAHINTPATVTATAANASNTHVENALTHHTHTHDTSVQARHKHTLLRASSELTACYTLSGDLSHATRCDATVREREMYVDTAGPSRAARSRISGSISPRHSASASS